MTKELKLPAELNSLSLFSDFVSDAVVAPQPIVSKILIACDEVLNNIANYSQAEYIKLVIEPTDKSVTLTFSDNGKHFNPLEQEDPDTSIDLSLREAGGLGIYLIKSLMDKVTYRRTDTENILTICKNLM